MMMIQMRTAITNLVLLLLASSTATADDTAPAATIGGDYIDAAPATVYEAEEMSPQNADYDKENNMFLAHGGWLNDKDIHYYKFRMYTPGTYPEVIAPGASSSDVPLQHVYFVTTDGTMAGTVGEPIIEYHTADGTVYSDFMVVVFVQAPEGYEANTLKSAGDVTASGYEMTKSEIVLNLPVVPTDSTLQDPAMGGTNPAPINPVPVWYKGVQVQTFVFEVTAQEAADYFMASRVNGAAEEFAYKIPVTNFASNTAVSAIPLWHVNQFRNGVTEGVNDGGPAAGGMKNIINLDRGDQGYSPLWSIIWVTELPMNYVADDVSSSNAITAEPFVSTTTPMFVNCPDIGDVGAEVNPDLKTDHEGELDVSNESNLIQGSHLSLIMQAGVGIDFMVGDEVIGTTETSPMGAYVLDLASADIPEGTTEIEVMNTATGESIRTISVTTSGGGDSAPEGDDSSSPEEPEDMTSSTKGISVVAAAASMVAFML